MPRRDVRGDMVAGAVRLLAENGLEGTSFAEVLALVDGPRGSVYHHFPGGKQELVIYAVKTARAHAMLAVDPWHGRPATVVVERFVDLWRQLLIRSQGRAGCSVLAVTVSAAGQPELLDEAAITFKSWREQLGRTLEHGGVPHDRSASVAATIIAGCEGAVAIARAERNLDSFEQVAAELMRMTAAAQTVPLDLD